MRTARLHFSHSQRASCRHHTSASTSASYSRMLKANGQDLVTRPLHSPPGRTSPRPSTGSSPTPSPSTQAATIHRSHTCSRTQRIRRKANSAVSSSKYGRARTARLPLLQTRPYSLGSAGHARALKMGRARQCPIQRAASRSDRRRDSARGRDTESAGMV